MNSEKKLSHIDSQGNPQMVNISEKKAIHRKAHAQSLMYLPKEILDLLQNNEIYTKKGAVFQTAVIAGVMGAKKTSELIPFCHPLGLDDCQINITINELKQVVIDCRVELTAKTGVEMEALTGVTIAALTVYDMCKALSQDIQILSSQLMEKTGGKKDFKRE